MPPSPAKSKSEYIVKSFADQELGGLVVGASVHEKSHEEPFVGVRGFVGTNSEHKSLISPTEAGVLGIDYAGRGVAGFSSKGQGVYGHCDTQAGVVGESTKGEGVRGLSHSAHHGGVVAINDGAGDALFATATGATARAVFATSKQWEGVHGETESTVSAGIAGFQLNPQGTGAGVYAESRGLGPAGFFKGDVAVTGDIRLLNAADCAEDFSISETEEVEPGTVMVINQEDILRPSEQAYDKKVAGVISGAGGYKPGIILDKKPSEGKRVPLALLGKVYCKVDARFSPIEVGDLLTTSPTCGYAMKASDPFKAFGSVIGKALRPLAEGRALIPILISLQ